MENLRVVNWEFALLKQDPFLNTSAVWAGFTDLRTRFDGLFVDALTTSRTQVVLNMGEFGSGKTHAAMYYSNPEHLPDSGDAVAKKVWFFHIKTPKEPEKANELLYQDIIEAVRLKQFREVVRDIIKELGQKNALERLQEVVRSDVLGRALWLLGLERDESGELTLFREDDASEEWQRLLETYFFSGSTKTDLKKLGLSREIGSFRDRFQVLSGIFHCLIGLEPIGEPEKYNRVVLWIDEMEDLIYFATQQYRPFTQGLRDLVDRLPHCFSLLMNFTLTSPEAVGDIGTVLGAALIDRLTDQIYFTEPSEEEALDYVRDLLKKHRVKDANIEKRGLSDTYPFDEEALYTLISGLPSRKPRHINQRCSVAITKSMQSGIISAPGQGIIDREFVRKLEKESLELDEFSMR